MGDERPLFSVTGLLPPPREDDRLFRSDDDWRNNACINYSHFPEALYNSGYRTAAQLLVKQVCETGREQDILVYPIVYLYRHHCELALKGITVIASELLDKELSAQEAETLGRHGLMALWTNLRPSLNAVCELVGNSAFPKEDLDGIDSYIEQIHSHDPDGQRFRYATLKKREKKKRKTKGVAQVDELSLRPELSYINIRTFGEAMETLTDYLEGIESWFRYLLDAKYEAAIEAAY